MISRRRVISCNAPRRALENGSMAAAFRGGPGLKNLRRITIEWLTGLPSQNKQAARREQYRFDVIYGSKAGVPERPI